MTESITKQFDALVAPHLGTLFRVAYRLVRNTQYAIRNTQYAIRNTQDAQDLVQDTCVTACSNLEQIAAADSAVRWLLRVQQNRFIDSRRRNLRSPVIAVENPEDDSLHRSDGADPELLFREAQNGQLLERAFLQLDESQRTLLSLRAEGYDLPEIEAITGIDRKLLSTRLHRARLILAHHLTEKVVVPLVGRRTGSKT